MDRDEFDSRADPLYDGFEAYGIQIWTGPPNPRGRSFGTIEFHLEDAERLFKALQMVDRLGLLQDLKLARGD